MGPSPEGPAREHRSSTSPSTRPTTSGPSSSHRCRQESWRERRAPGRSSWRWRTSTCTGPRTAVRSPRICPTLPTPGKVRVAIGRASDSFGPRVLVSAAGEQVFGRAVEGKSAQLAGDPDQPHTYTYVPDIGRGLVVLGEREEALGQVWHLPSPETLTTRQFVEMIFEEVGKPPRVQVAPKILLRTIGLFNPGIRETIEMLYEFEEPFVVDHSKFERAFGEHATPLEEAIQRTVRWYREERPAGK